MSSTCTPILVGVVSPILETNLAYGPKKWKNLIDRNRLKKFMQVGVNVTCMYTSFGGRDPSVLEIWLPFKNGQISLSGHGSIVMEKFNRSELAQKIYASRD